ncbi:hypothetical protein [Nocardia macrotermitis]|uniref:Uncharacterized protein n=1 Tax=Nocardia macrotermitis TaxID=2585198 RepID=A0A7K0D2L1_9NOCA|nr:hypothetical protein [Nocardia macrotermitis]MQY19492.1 hypothetical protein [Nocardia macrotermitis]
MTDASKSSNTGPLASLITEAQNGNLSVSFDKSDVVVNADEFVYIERDCQAMKQKIQDLQRIADRIANRSDWGLGDRTDGLTSAPTLVSRFRSKAAKAGIAATDSDDNVYDILSAHYKIIDDLETLHRTIAEKFVNADTEFAAEYNRLKADLPKSPISTNIQPGIVVSGVGKSI